MSVESGGSVEERLARARATRAEGRLEEARREAAAAVERAREGEDPLELLRALEALGQAQADLGASGEAERAYGEAVTVGRGRVGPRELAHAIRHLADARRRAQRPGAEPLYREALSLYREADATSPLELANALRPLALLLESRGSVAEARSLWEEARDLYARSGVQAGVRECEAHLADATGEA